MEIFHALAAGLGSEATIRSSSSLSLCLCAASFAAMAEALAEAVAAEAVAAADAPVLVAPPAPPGRPAVALVAVQKGREQPVAKSYSAFVRVFCISVCVRIQAVLPLSKTISQSFRCPDFHALPKQSREQYNSPVGGRVVDKVG